MFAAHLAISTLASASAFAGNKGDGKPVARQLDDVQRSIECVLYNPNLRRQSPGSDRVGNYSFPPFHKVAAPSAANAIMTTGWGNSSGIGEVV